MIKDNHDEQMKVFPMAMHLAQALEAVLQGNSDTADVRLENAEAIYDGYLTMSLEKKRKIILKLNS